MKSSTREHIPVGWLLLMALPFIPGGGSLFRHPIPYGDQNREKVKPFLMELCPNRSFSPALHSLDTRAPVAALFHIIRSGDEESARRAIAIAQENEFGYASPYVIERLEGDNAEVRESARAFLTATAGEDYGPSAESWRAWWRNPPTGRDGESIGQRTAQFAWPVVIIVWGSLVAVAARIVRRKPLTPGFFVVPLALAWFACSVVAGLRLVGSPEVCAFGGETINYWTSHGTVLGLEDARAGGFGLWILLTGIFGFPFGVIALADKLFFQRFRLKREMTAPPRASGGADCSAGEGGHAKKNHAPPGVY